MYKLTLIICRSDFAFTLWETGQLSYAAGQMKAEDILYSRTLIQTCAVPVFVLLSERYYAGVMRVFQAWGHTWHRIKPELAADWRWVWGEDESSFFNHQETIALLFKVHWLTMATETVPAHEATSFLDEIQPSCVWYLDRVFQVWGLQLGLPCAVGKLHQRLGNYAEASRHASVLLKQDMNPIRILHAHCANGWCKGSKYQGNPS